MAVAVGVLDPRLSGLAALGLVCLLVGATLTNVVVLGISPLLPLVLLVVSALAAWGRRERTNALLGGLGRRAQPRRGFEAIPTGRSGAKFVGRHIRRKERPS